VGDLWLDPSTTGTGFSPSTSMCQWAYPHFCFLLIGEGRADEALALLTLSLLMLYIYIDGAPGITGNSTSYIYGRDFLLGV
jgi:hypothetical protein